MKSCRSTGIFVPAVLATALVAGASFAHAASQADGTIDPSLANPGFENTADEIEAGFQPPVAQFASPCPGPTAFSGTLGVAQPGKINSSGTGRIFRDGSTTACGANTCPGNFGSQTQNYDVWPFTGAASDQCYTVVFNGGSCGSGFNVHPSAYCGTYPSGVAYPANCNPAPGVAYKGDSGSSPGLNANVTFRFCVPANTDWSLVAMNNFGAVSCNYSFTVSCASQGCTPDPNCGAPSSGSCNLAPIEAKLDRQEVKHDTNTTAIRALETKADQHTVAIRALESKADKLESKVDQFAAELAAIRAQLCEITRLMHVPHGRRTTETCGGHTWNEENGNPPLR